jgi:hypothetical protein
LLRHHAMACGIEVGHDWFLRETLRTADGVTRIAALTSQQDCTQLRHARA